MCGKFTALSSWRDVHSFSQPLVEGAGDVVTYGVAQTLPVIVFDRQLGRRRVVPMRWGFPHAKNWRAPQPIHARSETVDRLPAFADAFHDGQRGIVVMQTFNEGEEVGKKTVQWTIDPGDGVPRGFAFIWRRFEIAELDAPMLACVMCTVPASQLIAPITDRMPAILEDDAWPTWLGENDAAPGDVLAVLKTMEGVHWRMAREEKKPKGASRPPRDPVMF